MIKALRVVASVSLMVGCCSTSRKPDEPGVRSEVATVLDEKVVWYHTVSESYQMDRKSFPDEEPWQDLTLETICFHVVTRESWYGGMDGSISTQHVTAHMMNRDGSKGRCLWTISASSDEFHPGHAYDPKVYLLKYGCCGGPDEQFVFDAFTGKQTDFREREAGSATWVSRTNRVSNMHSK